MMCSALRKDRICYEICPIFELVRWCLIFELAPLPVVRFF